MIGDVVASFRRLDTRRKLASLGLIAVGLIVGFVIVGTQTGSTTGLLDLRIYLGAAREVVAGRSIYGFVEPTYQLGSTYPPFWSLVLVPVASADVHVLEYTWTTVNLALWFGAFAALAFTVESRGADEAPISFLGLTVVWFLSIPTAAVWNTLNQGQVNILVWFLVALDLRSVAAGSRGRGVLTGVATALKLIPGIFVLYFLLARNLRAVRNAVLAFVGVTAVSAVVVPEDARRYWTSVLFDSSRIGAIDDPLNNSLRSLLQHAGLSGTAELAVWAVGAAVVVGVTIAPVRRALARGSIISVAVLVGATSALVAPISWVHHLVFASFGLLLLVGPGRLWGRAASAVALAGITLVLVDPVGFGRSTPTAVIRTVLLIAAVAAGPWLVRAEERWRGYQVGLRASSSPVSWPVAGRAIR